MPAERGMGLDGFAQRQHERERRSRGVPDTPCQVITRRAEDGCVLARCGLLRTDHELSTDSLGQNPMREVNHVYKANRD